MPETTLTEADVALIVRVLLETRKFHEPQQFTTPPQVAKLLGVRLSKVITWIRRGELRAVNLAERTTGRVRWKIPPDALAEFLRSRQAVPPPPPTQRRRPAQRRNFEIFFDP